MFRCPDFCRKRLLLRIMKKMEIKEEQPEPTDPIWKRFLRKHLTFTIMAAGVIAAAIVGAVFVFLGVVDWALATGLVPDTLGAWTVGYSVTFCLNVLLYEFLIIGLPVIAGVAIGYLWYRKLPEKAEYESDPKKKSHSGDGGGAISFIVTIVWLIVVYTNNMWNTAFNLWNFEYLITSIFWAVGLVLLIGGIPIAIGGIWWLTTQLKE